MNVKIWVRQEEKRLFDELAAGLAKYSWGMARFEPLARLGNPDYVMPEELK